jgi:lipoprotein NlpI
MLEIPQPGGSTGKILIDTGSPFGLSLPPTQWQQWHAAHPNAPFTSRFFAISGSDAVQCKEAWADEIDLGPIHFTDVPVHQVTQDEIDIPGKNNFVGTIGLYALDRIDLIVDGKNGFAYLHPRPSPGPPYPGIDPPGIKADSQHDEQTRENWTLSDDVNLTLDNELVFVADRKLAIHDIKGAIQDCTQAIQIDPQNPHAYLNRGTARAAAGDIDGSLVDFTESIQLNPTDPDAYFNRGVIEGRRADYANSISDLNQVIQIDPQNPTAFFARGLGHQCQSDFPAASFDYQKSAQLKPGKPDQSQLYWNLVQLRLGITPTPAANPSDWKNPWQKSLDQFLLGTITESTLLATAEKPDARPVPAKECQAFYFIAEQHLAHNDRPTARTYFQKCLATTQKSRTEYTLSQIEFSHLDAE